MPYGFLCCGPGAERNVYYSSDDESDSGNEANVDVVRWPSSARDHDGAASLLPTDSPSVLPSRRRNTPELKKLGRSGPIASERDGERGIFSLLSAGLSGVNSSLRSFIFAPRPTRLSAAVAGGGERGGSAELNLAYRETLRLPDVAGEERVAWAAGVLRIDLTETGIRTLRGLDAFPNVQTLVLDSNGLLSLPMDCPWVPSLETLWLCNNDIENLDGLLCQVNDAFPRLTTLALMGNPVWPAAKSRAREGGRDSNETRGIDRLEQSRSSNARDSFSDARPGGRELGLETVEEKAYRLHVIRRLPGLVTLDCTDITEEERVHAKDAANNRLMDVTRLLLEPEATTDREESLSRDSPPTTGRTVAISLTGSGKAALVENERKRRTKLPDRSTLPSTWFKEPVVMDIGSGWTRMGLAGQDNPMCSFPTVVGRMDLRKYDLVLGQDQKIFVGHKAIEEANKRAAERELPTGRGPMPSSILLDHPVSGGVVTNWDDMEEIWRHGIEDEMGLDPVEHPILMADSTTTTPEEREKATEILFETMTTPAVHMALQPVLALYACGPSSGLVVDIGESGTQVAPIFDGFLVERGMRTLNIGGKNITNQLGALVNAKAGLMGGNDFDMKDPRDVLKMEKLKAKMCFVSEDIDRENKKMELSISKPLTLPDGTKITLGRERYRAAEILFDPASAARTEESLQDTVLDAILACERKTWAILSQTVILTGGTTELVGLNRRLQRELTRASRASGIRLKFTVMVPEDDHNNTVWVGGSMLASTGALDGLWFTRAEYDEYGAGSIHAKFAA